MAGASRLSQGIDVLSGVRFHRSREGAHQIADRSQSDRRDQLEWIKQEFYVRAYGDHPYGRPTIGTEESIKSITPADLEAFHRAEWTPNRAVVVLVGDVKPEEVATFISKNWA
jgi:zinc protease